MATLSVNTNYSARVALQQLMKTNTDIEQTQSRINTGMKVSTAKDNGAIFAIAQGMRSESTGFAIAQQSLDRATSTVDIALAAGASIADLLLDMRNKSLAAKDQTLTDKQREAYNEDFVTMRDQITSIVENAEFNGVNLIDGATSSIKALANHDGSSTISVKGEDMSLAATGTTDWSTVLIQIAEDETITTASQADAVLTRLDTSINNLNMALARLGSSFKALDIHNTFLTKLNDTLTAGIGNLVDADLAKESARLQALQTKQQLGVQALSIANQAPQIINALFQ